MNAIMLATIKRETAHYYGLTIADMESPKRHRRLSHPRQVAMALSCRLTSHSLPAIGRAFGGRDHTTVLYARDQVALREAQNPALRRAMAVIRACVEMGTIGHIRAREMYQAGATP